MSKHQTINVVGQGSTITNNDKLNDQIDLHKQ